MWTLSNLLRIAHSAACADLADYARSSATTYADGFARGGELVEEAERLMRDAEDVRLLAVAAERSRGVSWEAIGEALGGVSKQAAEKRFSERVEQLELDILLPEREGPYVGAQPNPGWTAGPDVAAHPDEWSPRLDAWAKRHHERTDGGKDHLDHLISHGLREPRALDHMGAVTKLTALLLDSTGAFARRELPPGVTERYARRRLLEAKLALYDAMRADSSSTDSDAREQAAHAFEQLVEIRTEEVREILTTRWNSDDEATIALRERPVAILARSHDQRRPRDPRLVAMGRRRRRPGRRPRRRVARARRRRPRTRTRAPRARSRHPDRRLDRVRPSEGHRPLRRRRHRRTRQGCTVVMSAQPDGNLTVPLSIADRELLNEWAAQIDTSVEELARRLILRYVHAIPVREPDELDERIGRTLLARASTRGDIPPDAQQKLRDAIAEQQRNTRLD